MITGDLIQRRIDSFWGYGSLEAPVWFVGMEEGLAPTVSEAWLQERFRATAGKITVDMRRDMARVPDHMCWFRKGANVQSTWRLQIELYLYLKNHRKRADKERKEEIRSYQILELGDIEKKQTRVLDLMPLPSRKSHQSTWLYSKYNVHGLSCRREYINLYKSRRTRRLRELIGNCRPRLVVFSSVDEPYLSSWREVVQTDLEPISRQMYFAQEGPSCFRILPHATSAVSYDRIYEYADEIRNRVKF